MRKSPTLALVAWMALSGLDGQSAATFFGAPPTLHGEAEATLASLLR